MATPMQQEDINFLRLAGLLIRIAPIAVRQHFDNEFDPKTLSQFLQNKGHTIDELLTKRVITQIQYNLLYRKGSSETFDVSLMVCLLRNFADLDIHDTLPLKHIHDTGADISRIKCYRNYIVHSNSGKVTDDEFTEIWNCVVEAILRLVPDLKSEIDALMGSPLTNVEEMKNNIRLEKELAEINLKLDATNQKLEKLEIGNHNIAEIRNAILKEWRDTDMKYVSTTAMTFIKETLQHNMAVIITGSPGCGKSTVAHHVALKLEEEGFELIPLDYPSEIHEIFTKLKKQVFVIDDLCGKFALNKYEADKWEKNNLALDKLMVSCNQSDNIIKFKFPAKFIFTCRENIFTHKSFPKLTCFSLVQCNFSTKHKISQVEMRKIALSYVSDQTVNDIPNICLYDFFPLLCALYSKMNHPDPRFFMHPLEIIEKEIAEMKTKSETDFICLSLLVLKNNECSKAELLSGELKRLLKDICREGEIESVVSPVSIQQSFERFKDIYISGSDQNYKAIHDKMFDIISAAIAPSIVECLIEHVDIAFLANRSQLSSLGKNDLPFVIYIPQKFERIYMQRQFKEVLKGKYWEVFGSMQTENEDYRNLLLSFMKDQDTSPPIMYVPGADGATPLFVSSSLGYMNFVQYFLVKSPDDKNAKDKKGRSSFYVACKNGHIATVKYLLKSCVDITIKDTDGLSALHAACCSGRKEIVKLLIDVGMNINDTTEKGLPPLHLACKSGRFETVKFLLDMNQPTMNRYVDTTIKDTAGNTALHHACSNGDVNVVLLLIDAGLDITDKDNLGLTPFMSACIRGKYNVVQFLLRKFENVLPCIVDMTLRDNGHCEFALHAACYAGNPQLIQLLMDVGIDINSPTKDGITPLSIACRFGRLDTVKFLLDLNGQTANSRVNLLVKNSNGFNALHVACYNGHAEIVEILIDAGMNENDKTNREDTPLCLACVAGHFDTVKFLLDLKDQSFNSRVDLLSKDSVGFTALHKACCNGHTEIVKILIDAGMNVNDPTKDGYTALFLACAKGRYDTVQFLLDLNAKTLSCPVDLISNDSNGYTAFHASCYNGHTEVVKILIDAGMNVNDTTNDGSTPLMLACREGHYDTVKFLLNLKGETSNSRVDSILRDSSGMTVLHAACCHGHTEVVKILIDAGMNVNDKTNEGLTPLYLACRRGHFDTVKLLLNLKDQSFNNLVDSTIKDLHGRTALHSSCINGHAEVVKILIDAGMNVNEKTNEGLTPLYLACRHGHLDTMQFLLDSNDQICNSRVDSTITDLHGWTALHSACMNGHAEVVRILIDTGMNVNEKTKEGFTPLHLACGSGRYVIDNI